MKGFNRCTAAHLCTVRVTQERFPKYYKNVKKRNIYKENYMRFQNHICVN